MKLSVLLFAGFPRLAVFIVWVARPGGGPRLNSFIWPLLGIIFLPFAT
jgi:hypothetical protein